MTELETLVQSVTDYLITLVAAIAVLFIVIAGISLLLPVETKDSSLKPNIPLPTRSPDSCWWFGKIYCAGVL